MVNGSARDKPGASENSSPPQNQTLFAVMRVEPESRQASRQNALARACAIQTQLQEYFIFVRSRNRMDRREREQAEPALHVRRKIVRACLGRGVHPASEPFGRETKSDSFGKTRVPPLLPESVVRRSAIEEERELIDVQDSQAAAKQMPHYMPAGIVERVHGIERGQTNAIEFRDAPPFAEALGALCLKSKRWVAEPKMHLRSEGLIRIEVIAAPAPSGAPYHHGQMIRALRFLLAHLIAERFESLHCAIRHRRWNVEIDVVLRAMHRRVIPDTRVREPLEHQKLDPVRIQNGGNFAMGLHDSLMARSIPGESRAELFGRRFTAARGEGKRNMSLVAQNEKRWPLAGWNRCKRP
jgi:hypothetical protein